MEVYLDNNSTTQMDPRIEDIFVKNIKKFANINAIYNKGIETRTLLNDAYDTLYDGIGAENTDDIIITSSTTEGNNTVIKTFLHEFLTGSEKNHIISTVAEHSSIKEPLKYCKDMGMDVTYIDTDENGLVNIDKIEEAITDKTCLISVLVASNKTGAIQDIKKITQIAKKHNVFLHSDGAQALGKMEIDVTELGIDYFTFSAHKFHGPKGIGGLYVKDGVPYNTLIHGIKDVMANKRAGSLFNNGIAAMATAVEIANINLSYLESYTQILRDKLEDRLLKITDSKSYVPRDKRLKNTLSISFRGVNKEAMLWDMNKNGIYISTGSIFSKKDIEAEEKETEISEAIIIFALSKFTTETEINYVIEKVESSVKRIREISMTNQKEKIFV